MTMMMKTDRERRKRLKRWTNSWLKTLAAPPKDPSSIPSSLVKHLLAALTPAPWNLLASVDTHTHDT